MRFFSLTFSHAVFIAMRKERDFNKLWENYSTVLYIHSTHTAE